MFKKNLIVAWRFFVNDKFQSFINVFGLSVGIAGFLLIVLFVRDEQSFDKFHSDYERIYRVTEVNYNEGEESLLANAYSAIGPALKSDFPEFEAFVRIHFEEEVTVDYGPDLSFEEDRFAFADSTLWNVLDFNLLQGSPDKTLSEPFSVVLTESSAEKYFGSENPIGRSLKINGQYDFKVTGILEDIPQNSHLQFDFVASFLSLRQLQGGWMFNNWYWPPMYTYVKLPGTVSVSDVEAKFPSMITKYLGQRIVTQRNYQLQPLTSIHTSTSHANEIGKPINRTYLTVLAISAILILLIASVNFTNLSLAKSISRSEEVGVRKVFGASRKQIIIQYLSESLIVSFMSGLLGFTIFLLALPTFNQVTGKSLSLGLVNLPIIASLTIGVSIFLGLASGFYPALFLSGFSPVSILKGSLAKKSKLANSFKKVLITFQFGISATLIIATLIIYFQLSYMQNKSLGFNTEQKVVIEVKNYPDQNRIKALKDRIEQLSQVTGAAVSSRIPGHEGFYDYNVLAEGETADNSRVFMRLETDLDFADLYDFEILKGRNFDPNLGTDSASYLINETAALKLGWSESNLNQKLFMGSLTKEGSFQKLHEGRVIGIVKDFNFASLHSDIDPVIISVIPKDQPYMQSKLTVSLAPGNLMESMSAIEEEWRSFTPNSSFDYFFLDQTIEQLYRSERTLSQVFLSFASLSIILACLGLFSMTTLLATQLKKQIGIRKVLGASIRSIVFLISRDFMALILIAFVLASGLVYLVMGEWLQNFAFHIDMKIWYFLIGGLALALISFLTISIKSVGAAKNNPVDSLRYE